MNWKIVTIAGPNDTYEVPLEPEDRLLRVPFNVQGDPDHLQSSIAEEFSRYGLAFTPATEDILNFAVAAYTADVRVSRREAFDSWTRSFELHLFVNCVEEWEACQPAAEELLAFLTGDHWVLRVRPTPDPYVRHAPAVNEVFPISTDTVSLFSGGLDSFVGAIDALEAYENVTLVGHHSQGSGATSKSQANAIRVIRGFFPVERAPFLQLWLSPPKGEARASETSTRGRSILFLGLGVSVAAAMNAARLIVPENGVISLNAPLTPSRLGSFSTRTTHPHMIELFRSMLKELGIPVAIELPYRFATKGEMLRKCDDQAVLAEGIDITMSCARPAAGRFPFGGSPNRHCGRCIPCIIRRASLLSSGIPDPTKYSLEDLSSTPSGESGTDLRVMRLALERYTRRSPSIEDILKAGPLPGTDTEKRSYLDVFLRGISEIRALLQ